MFYSKSKAQGTIEYLVILAVVVVIALVVVALFIGVSSSPSQEIMESSSRVGEVAVGGISIVESVVDSEGDSLVFLSNNSSDAITLKKISVGSVDNNFDNVLVGLDSKGFSLSGLSSSCPCASGQKSVKCEFKIEYLTVSGITKIEYRAMNVLCVTDSAPVDEDKIVDPIVPVLELGTLENPWIVNDCLELQDMNQHLDGNYILGNDIDCSDTINWNGGLGFKPISGECSEYLMGGCVSYNPVSITLDGQGHKISNLYINRPDEDNAALFNVSSGFVKRTNLENVNISAGYMVGAIASQLTDNGNYVEGYGRIEDCTSSGNLVVGGGTGSIIGGLIGSSYGGIIVRSFSTANVSGDNYIGGLIGAVSASDVASVVQNSFSVGEVDNLGQNDVYGGLLGYNEYTGFSNGVSNCYWNITTSTQDYCYYNYYTHYTNEGCTSANQLSDYYGASGLAKLGNGSNWTAVEGGFPVLTQ